MSDTITPIKFETQSDSLIIKIEKDEFANFIKGLLGRPQIIENHYNAPFELNKTDIFSIHHLIHQRIEQQNSGQLIQFTIKTIYNDNSSILVSNINDFTAHTEVRPLEAIKVIATWIYLIQFSDRRVPEKQMIELTIKSKNSDESELKKRHTAEFNGILDDPSFILKIEHTARTWGEDMENLISNFIKNWYVKENVIKKTILQNGEKIGRYMALFMFLSLSYGAITFLNDLSENKMRKAIQDLASASIDEKILTIVHLVNGNISTSNSITSMMIIVGITYISFTFGGLMVILSKNRPESFICFTSESIKRKDVHQKELQKSWSYFVATAITGTISGVLSRYIYTWLF